MQPGSHALICWNHFLRLPCTAPLLLPKHPRAAARNRTTWRPVILEHCWLCHWHSLADCLHPEAKRSPGVHWPALCGSIGSFIWRCEMTSACCTSRYTEVRAIPLCAPSVQRNGRFAPYIVPVSVQQLCASQAVAHYLAAVVDDELDSQLLHGFAQKPRPSYLLTRSWATRVRSIALQKRTAAISVLWSLVRFHAACLADACPTNTGSASELAQRGAASVRAMFGVLRRPNLGPAI